MLKEVPRSGCAWRRRAGSKAFRLPAESPSLSESKRKKLQLSGRCYLIHRRLAVDSIPALSNSRAWHAVPMTANADRAVELHRLRENPAAKRGVHEAVQFFPSPFYGCVSDLRLRPRQERGKCRFLRFRRRSAAAVPAHRAKRDPRSRDQEQEEAVLVRFSG